MPRLNNGGGDRHPCINNIIACTLIASRRVVLVHLHLLTRVYITCSERENRLSIDWCTFNGLVASRSFCGLRRDDDVNARQAVFLQAARHRALQNKRHIPNCLSPHRVHSFAEQLIVLPHIRTQPSPETPPSTQPHTYLKS